MAKNDLKLAMKHILLAYELVQGVIDENNESLMKIFGFELHKIANGLMAFGDNRDNLFTNQIGLDTIIEEEGIIWRDDQPDDKEEISKWLDKIEEILPEVYKEKYFTSSNKFKNLNFRYSPILDETEEKEFMKKYINLEY